MTDDDDDDEQEGGEIDDDEVPLEITLKDKRRLRGGEVFGGRVVQSATEYSIDHNLHDIKSAAHLMKAADKIDKFILSLAESRSRKQAITIRLTSSYHTPA